MFWLRCMIKLSGANPTWTSPFAFSWAKMISVRFLKEQQSFLNKGCSKKKKRLQQQNLNNEFTGLHRQLKHLLYSILQVLSGAFLGTDGDHHRLDIKSIWRADGEVDKTGEISGERRGWIFTISFASLEKKKKKKTHLKRRSWTERGGVETCKKWWRFFGDVWPKCTGLV